MARLRSKGETHMQSQTLMPPAPVQGWFSRAEAFLDQRGKPAWIALGFIFFWPVGLALLFYMIWSNRMFGKSCTQRSHRMTVPMGSSGNSAFDAYKADTLKRLEDEQRAFEGFLGRLREAKDKAEFDQFMADRARKAREEAVDAETVEA